jgi:hypothetical protein
MNPADDVSGITQLVQGDASRARELRANLAVFARKSDSPEIHKLVSEVLAGRRSVRQVFRTKEFNDAGMRGMTNIEKGIAQLTDEQRAELWDPTRPRTPDETVDALRDAYDVSPPAVEVPSSPEKSVRVEDEDFSQKSFLL